MVFPHEHDVEAGEKPRVTNKTSSTDYIVDDGVVSATLFTLGNSRYARIQRIAGKFGVEQRGIERVPSCERSDTSMLQTGTLVRLSVELVRGEIAKNYLKWLSCNMVVSAFAIGALAWPVFRLGFVDAILIIFFVNLLGIIPVCFFSTFGPRFGLRQMVLSRFFFGMHGVKVGKTSPPPSLIEYY